MISYRPFFQTLLKKNITEYALIYKQGISANTIHRMKKGYQLPPKHLMNYVLFWIVELMILLN